VAGFAAYFMHDQKENTNQQFPLHTQHTKTSTERKVVKVKNSNVTDTH